MYSDEYIEHWGAIFEAERLYEVRGIRFDTFLIAPHEILEAVADLPQQAPLLPEQAAAMHVDLEESLLPADAELRGTGYVQPIRHHTYDVSHDRHRNLASGGAA